MWLGRDRGTSWDPVSAILSRLPEISLVLFVVSLVLIIVGFASPYWVSLDSIHYELELNEGLWYGCYRIKARQYHFEAVGQLGYTQAEQCKDEVTEWHAEQDCCVTIKSDGIVIPVARWSIAVRMLAGLSMLCLVVGTIAYTYKFLSIVCHGMAALTALIGGIIYAAKLGGFEVYEGELMELRWSFITYVIGAVLLAAAAALRRLAIELSGSSKRTRTWSEVTSGTGVIADATSLPTSGV